MAVDLDAMRQEGIEAAKLAITGANYKPSEEWGNVAATAAFDAIMEWVGKQDPKAAVLHKAFDDALSELLSKNGARHG